MCAQLRERRLQIVTDDHRHAPIVVRGYPSVKPTVAVALAVQMTHMVCSEVRVVTLGLAARPVHQRNRGMETMLSTAGGQAPLPSQIPDILPRGAKAGPWIVERELGRGGMGAVLAVVHDVIG